MIRGPMERDLERETLDFVEGISSDPRFSEVTIGDLRVMFERVMADLRVRAELLQCGSGLCFVATFFSYVA
jgi:hypothetical protein